MNALPLFEYVPPTAIYPYVPGSKDEGASIEAAILIQPKANIVREMAKQAFLKWPEMTASECSSRIGVKEDTVSPRLSELKTPQHGCFLKTVHGKRKPRVDEYGNRTGGSESYYALNPERTA